MHSQDSLTKTHVNVYMIKAETINEEREERASAGPLPHQKINAVMLFEVYESYIVIKLKSVISNWEHLR